MALCDVKSGENMTSKACKFAHLTFKVNRFLEHIVYFCNIRPTSADCIVHWIAPTRPTSILTFFSSDYELLGPIPTYKDHTK